MSTKKILVTGATGQQGGSVINALVGKGYSIFGMTRNPNSDRAKALAGRGVEVVAGDFRDKKALAGIFKRVDSVFLISTPFEAGVDDETVQAINAVEAAGEAGVKYLLFSSVASADRNTTIPHFESKYTVEQFLVKSGIPYTITAPVFFYDNLFSPWMLPALQNGTLALALPAERQFQSVSLKNIGEFNALILDNPDRFLSKRIDYAGDALSGTEYAEALSRASGRKIGYFEAPIEKVRESSEDMAVMYEWFDRIGYSVDIEAQKRQYPEVPWEAFEQWAQRQDWSILEAARAS
jgi:uncharacterized protein YbjT (DUF2867 family)